MLKHLDYLMISNGGSDPFHYLKGQGGLGYKPSPPYMHGLGYDYNLIDGGGFNSYKNKFNTSHDLPKDESHTLDEISKLTSYSKKGLQTIYNKGIGAYHTNPSSVRPQVKSPEQWAMARVYAAINPKSKAHRVDKSHLKGLGFESEFPEREEKVSELLEEPTDENEEALANLLIDDFKKIEDIDEKEEILPNEQGQINEWLDIYNVAKEKGFFEEKDPRNEYIREVANSMMEYKSSVQKLIDIEERGKLLKEKTEKKKTEKNLLRKSMDAYKEVDRYENIEHPQNIRNQVVKISDEIKEPLGISYEVLVERLKALRHSNIGMNDPELIPGKYNIYDVIAKDKNGNDINWELKNYSAEWPSTKKFGDDKASNFIQDYQTLKKNYEKNFYRYEELPKLIEDIENKMDNPNITEKSYKKLEDKFISLSNELDELPNKLGFKIQKAKYDGGGGEQIPLFHKVNGKVLLYNIFPKKDGIIDFKDPLRKQNNTEVKALVHYKKGEYVYDLTGDPNLELVPSYEIKGIKYYKLVPKNYLTINGVDGKPYYHVDPKQLRKIDVEKMT